MTANESPKTNSAIGVTEVMHIAYLVRLGMGEDEARIFSQQFSEIIDHFRLLNELDTSSVLPTSQTSNIRNVMRADEVQPSMPRQDFMKNVPHQSGDHVQVPKIFGEEQQG